MNLLETLAEWLRDEPERVMALATANARGAPSVRMTSLRGITARGVRFFTGHESRKGRELAENPRAAALFFFRSPRRQARLEGPVVRLSDEESDAYYLSRPLEHRRGAWVQGARIATLDELERDHDPTQRPAHWGGYELIAEAGELWIAGENRRHVRWRFEGGERFLLAP